ncbi:MAG: twin-arginine translocase TatA/TatE family subunit [Nitrososphaerota archaeon]
MAQIGPIELVLIVLLIVMVLRPRTITDIARNLGKLVHEYRAASRVDDGEIYKVASILGIETKGKDVAKLGEEIRRKLKSIQ